MSKQIRVLPADVYDFLELSALAFGGIGGGTFGGTASPYCVWGHATDFHAFASNEVTRALENAGIGYDENDDAVDAILARRRTVGTVGGARVTFKQWAKQLGVVRGDV